MVTISRSGGSIIFTAADGRVAQKSLINFNYSEDEVGVFRFQDNEADVLCSFLVGPQTPADFQVSPSTGGTLANLRADLAALNPGFSSGGSFEARIAALEAFEASQQPVVFNQATPAATWSIPHTFASSRPNAVVTDLAGQEVECVKDYSNPVLLVLSFIPAQAGKATLTT